MKSDKKKKQEIWIPSHETLRSEAWKGRIATLNALERNFQACLTDMVFIVRTVASVAHTERRDNDRKEGGALIPYALT